MTGEAKTVQQLDLGLAKSYAGTDWVTQISSRKDWTKSVVVRKITPTFRTGTGETQVLSMLKYELSLRDSDLNLAGNPAYCLPLLAQTVVYLGGRLEEIAQAEGKKTTGETKGIYSPFRNPEAATRDRDRVDRVTLLSEVAVEGGFASGPDETSLGQHFSAFVSGIYEAPNKKFIVNIISTARMKELKLYQKGMFKLFTGTGIDGLRMDKLLLEKGPENKGEFYKLKDFLLDGKKYE